MTDSPAPRDRIADVIAGLSDHYFIPYPQRLLVADALLAAFPVLATEPTTDSDALTTAFVRDVFSRNSPTFNGADFDRWLALRLAALAPEPAPDIVTMDRLANAIRERSEKFGYDEYLSRQEIIEVLHEFWAAPEPAETSKEHLAIMASRGYSPNEFSQFLADGETFEWREQAGSMLIDCITELEAYKKWQKLADEIGIPEPAEHQGGDGLCECMCHPENRPSVSPDEPKPLDPKPWREPHGTNHAWGDTCAFAACTIRPRPQYDQDPTHYPKDGK